MRNLIAAGTVVAAALTGAAASGCATDPLGNSYCKEASNIIFTGLSFDGEFNDITKIDETTGSCSSAPKAYSGGLGPLGGEVSLHFRGRLWLKELHVYMPGGSGRQEKEEKPESYSRHRRHAHQKFHKRNMHVHELHERACGEMVHTVIDGKPVSFPNTYGCEQTQETGDNKADKGKSEPKPSKAAKPDRKPFTPAKAEGGDWTRVAYYNAEEQIADGLTFLNNMGGQGSGTFSYAFGNSLSYASSDAKSGCEAPEILADAPISSNNEITILTDKPCEGDSCGYVREGSVAYHGWEGVQKAFCAKYSMPLDGERGFNGDMPAFWMLNARIPRTLQYPEKKPQCSCWSSDCGELDIMEVLYPGDKRCKATFHGKHAGGSPDYLPRPTDKFIKVCTVMANDEISIQILDDATELGPSLPAPKVKDILSPESTADTSVFQLA